MARQIFLTSFLVFVGIFTVARAGVLNLQPHEQSRILQHFDELCASGRVPETGQLVNLGGQQSWVYCKKEKGRHTKNLQHTVKYEGPAQHPQTVFLKPADWLINSNVLVEALLKSAGVNIHVLPPEIKSEVSVTVRPDIQPPQKPRVAFLSSSSGSGVGQTSNNRPFSQNPYSGQRLDSFARSASASSPVAATIQQGQQAPAVRSQQQQQRQVAAADQVAAMVVQAQQQQRPQRQVEGVPVTWQFLMDELQKNGNNRGAVYYVLRRA